MDKRIYTHDELAALGLRLISFRAAYRTEDQARYILESYPEAHTPFLVLFDDDETHRFGVCDERDLARAE